MAYSTIEAGRKLGLSVHTLRYYETIGLMPEIARDRAGSRMYTDQDISWIFLVRCMRDIDMPVQNIRAYIDLVKDPRSTLEERRSMVEAFKKEVDGKLKKYLIVQRLIDKKLELYDRDILAGGTEADACLDQNSDWEDLLSVLEGIK
jgi:DNA-binding transcriptional MerR regulator